METFESLPANFWSLNTALFIVASYVYGSIPYAFLFTYLFTRKKLNITGTGNLGVANAFGVGGLTAGFLTVAGEASKGILPVVVSYIYYDGSLAVSLMLITVGMIGYGFSFFLKGKGGQGGTILLWALLVLSPFTLVSYILVTGVIYFASRRRHLASTLGYVLLPVEILLIEQNLAFVLFGVFMAIYHIARYNPQQSDYGHYKSEMRILRSFEKKFGEASSLIIPLARVRNSSKVGFKAFSLHVLKAQGVTVPETYICPFSAYKRYRENDPALLDEIRGSLQRVLKEDTLYSVRSSANLEDSEAHSFAGQFESYLNIGTLDEMIIAIKNVWESVQSERVRAYLGKIGKPPDALQMAVIIQEMVDSRFSGVVFTINPVTALDEVITEAVPGLGDGLNNPDTTLERWVYKWGNWLEKPVNAGISEETISDIFAKARSIAAKYGSAIDLEWAYDGKDIYWLQLRPITSVQGVNIYSNKISKEFLPGMIKPLVWSVNIPVVNSSWKKLLIECIGKDAGNIDIHNLTKSIYYRAYFNMGIMGDMFELLGMPRELLEILIGLEVEKENGPVFRPGIRSMKYMPRLLLFLARSLFFKRKIRRFLKEYGSLYHDAASTVSRIKDETGLLQAIDSLVIANTNASYYVIVTILLMGLYTRMFKMFLRFHHKSTDDFKWESIRKDIQDIDPNNKLGYLNDIYQQLPEAQKASFLNDTIQQVKDTALQEKLQDAMAKYLERFGHLSDSGNDFSKPQWKETPWLVRSMIATFKPSLQKANDTAEGTLRDSLPRNPLLRFMYRNSLDYQKRREEVNYVYTYGYSLFRPHFLGIANLWKEKGYINNEDDIFYLSHKEIIDITKKEIPPDKIIELVHQRRDEMSRVQNLRLPSVIIGNSLPPVITKENIVNVLHGVPVSKGNCTGSIAIVNGIGDFSKVTEGDILVIPYSDVSWTPFFVNAKGVISESGGMLSHCAIVAREYGIPAVVSVPDALSLRDGTRVILDGDKGEVIIIG